MSDLNRSFIIDACALAFLAVLAAGCSSAQAQARALTLGREVNGVLDKEDHAQVEYSFRLQVGRGIYRLAVSGEGKHLPAVCLTSEALEEEVCLSPFLFKEPVFTLTLPSGEYLLIASNDEEIPRLSYRLRLEFIGPWDDSREWEPNEEPSQELAAGKKVAGELTGLEDEDRFVFVIGAGKSDRPPAHDFFLKAPAESSLMLKVGAAGQEEDKCRLGLKSGEGYRIRGLALPEGRYIVSVASSLSAILSSTTGGKQPYGKFEIVPYTLEIQPANRKLISLVTRDEAVRAAFSITDQGEIRESANPRTRLEEEIIDFNRSLEKEQSKAGAAGVFPPSRLMEKHRALYEKTAGLILQAREEAWRASLGFLSRDPVLAASCEAMNKRYGKMTPELARAFARLWPSWSDVPDDLAMEILDGPAARLLTRLAKSSRGVLSASLVAAPGLLAAGTDIPSSLWQADHESWKAWIKNPTKCSFGDPVFDKDMELWTVTMVVPICLDSEEGTCRNYKGVVFIRKVLGR
ncbi:MAG TPA: PDC sensor domain-containing protein [Acidobacteriota bacterium]